MLGSFSFAVTLTPSELYPFAKTQVYITKTEEYLAIPISSGGGVDLLPHDSYENFLVGGEHRPGGDATKRCLGISWCQERILAHLQLFLQIFVPTKNDVIAKIDKDIDHGLHGTFVDSIYIIKTPYLRKEMIKGKIIVITK
jgi:hypothetical protein